jgi:hypothetical protein
MTHVRMGLVGCGVLAVLLGGCDAQGGNGADENTSVQDIGIVNGTTASAAFVSTYGMVAVYHHDSVVPTNWFPRPCSGTIIRDDGTYSWVLTARHCVTTDLTPTGPVQTNLSYFRLLPGTNPGPSSPSAPPAGSIAPNLIVAAPIASQQSDIALIRVSVNWQDNVSAAAFLMSPMSSVVNAALTATGYGVSNLDSSCDTDYDQTGAGIARYAGGFTINSGTSYTAGGGALTFANSSAGAQAHVICGDSGGMDLANWPLSDPQFGTQVGVHSSVAVPVGTGNANDTYSGGWVSNILDGIYVFQLGVGNWTWDSNHNLVLGAAAFPYFIYTEQTQTVWVDIDDGDLCLQKRSSTDNHAMFSLCNQSAAQKWQVTADNRIQNPSTNTCLQASGSSVIVTTCAASNAPLATRRAQTWYWSGSPDDLGD